MAKRPVYTAEVDGNMYVKKEEVEFQWYPGFAVSQKQKSIDALHSAFIEMHPEKKVLEISSKSPEENGIRLSAFNLMIKSKNKSYSLECAFQGSKAFEKGGPYREIFDMTSIDAKRYEKLKSSGELIGFDFYGIKWELEPKTLFYDWLYINAIHKNRELAEYIVQFDAFTDIEFNPKKSVNSQCKAAALYVSLYRRGRLEKALEDREGKGYREVISEYFEIKNPEVQKKLGF
jgi:hypothetical protein